MDSRSVLTPKDYPGLSIRQDKNVDQETTKNYFPEFGVSNDQNVPYNTASYQNPKKVNQAIDKNLQYQSETVNKNKIVESLQLDKRNHDEFQILGELNEKVKIQVQFTIPNFKQNNHHYQILQSLRKDISDKIKSYGLESENWTVQFDQQSVNPVTPQSSDIFNQEFFNKYVCPFRSLCNVLNNTFISKSDTMQNTHKNLLSNIKNLQNKTYDEFDKNKISDAEKFMKYFYLQIPIKQVYYNLLPYQSKTKIICCFFFQFFNSVQLLVLFGDFWPKIKLYIPYKNNAQS
jgi:hypothetical protein